MGTPSPGPTVALVNAVPLVQGDDLRQAVASFFHNHLIAETLVKQGFRVVCIQAFHDERTEIIDGIEVRTFKTPDRASAPALFQTLGLENPHAPVARDLLRLVKSTNADIVHCYGLSLWMAYVDVLRWAHQTGRTATMSDHGGRPPRHPIRRWRMARMLRMTEAIFTPSQDRAQAWDRALKLGPVWVVQPEISTPFPLLAQGQARARTNMSGDPVICSTSNLLPGKRPHLMLDAFEALLPHWPKAHLYLCYRFDDMLPALRARLEDTPELTQAVTLMGQVPRDQMADLYNSADIFLLTSEREIGSTSFTEATACGAIPACTELASLREMSGAGQIGVLFPPEASGQDIAKAMLPLRNQISERHRGEIRAHFETHLSYDRIVNGMVAQWARPRRT